MKASSARQIKENIESDDHHRHYLRPLLEGLLKMLNQSLKTPYSVVTLEQDEGHWDQYFFGELKNSFHHLDSYYPKITLSENVCEFENALGIRLKDHENKTVGVFCVMDHPVRKFSNADHELLEVAKKQIETILENIRLMRFVSDQSEIILQNSRLATLGQMTAEIVHEINNPLSIIQARLDLMMMHAMNGVLTCEMAKDSLNKQLMTMERIVQIIKGVKGFSRNIDHDPFENIKVSEMLDYSLSFCLDRLKVSSVKLIKDSIPEHLLISCRSVQISQVIVNLVNNAIDATGGVMDRWIRISVQDLGDRAAIKVIDCGRGIEPKVLEKLFSPFFTTKRNGQGTGLGLSISKSIVEAHQGTLEYSEIAGHTSFVIELPKVT